jgi:hypothetical protein
VVAPADLPSVLPPAYDTAPIQRYLRALDAPGAPAADFQWTSQHSARISTAIRAEDLLSVQVSWDPGWSARVSGAPRRVWGDKLGQVVVEPRCEGPCVVELTWDGGAEMAIARWTSRLAFGGALLWIILWRRRSGSTKTN